MTDKQLDTVLEYLNNGVINEALITPSALKQVNKDIKDIIYGDLSSNSNDKYTWYFINITTLKNRSSMFPDAHTKFTVIGFEDNPGEKYTGKSGLGIASSPVNHKSLYENKIKGEFSRSDLDPELRKFTKFNTGAAK